MSPEHPKDKAGPRKPDMQPNEGASGRPVSSREGETGKKNEAASLPPPLTFYTPITLQEMEIPEGWNMAGDWHFQRGGFAILAGSPGVGKSRAAMALALQMARGDGEWLGLKIHGRFKVLILQNENSLARLHRDFAPVQGLEEVNDWIRVSGPPPLGFQLGLPEFREALKKVMAEFQPDVVICDPLNALIRDSQERDVAEAFGFLREIMAASPTNPMCLLLHHLRKPKSEDKHKGRNLSNLLAGSYTIFSVARSVLVLQSADASDTTERRVVLTCSKNNDGPEGLRTAWEWYEGTGYAEVFEFDFDTFDSGGESSRAGGHNEKISETDIRAVLNEEAEGVAKGEAVKRLMERTGCKDKAAYAALADNGRFGHLIEIHERKVLLRDG